jgi:hypothetical protein
MVEAVHQLLKQYGNPITLRRDGAAVDFRGFLQHSGSKSWQNMRSIFTVLGQMPGGQYVLIAPPEPALEPEDTLLMGGRSYVIRTLEPVLYGRQVLYQWGLCENKGGEDS